MSGFSKPEALLYLALVLMGMAMVLIVWPSHPRTAPTVANDVDTKREYFPVSVCGMATNHHTHVSVTGTVTYIEHEGDGDTHIRIEDGGCFIVAECIPQLPCVHPKKGQTVTVWGISRYDLEHHWPEIHPLERITIESSTNH